MHRQIAGKLTSPVTKWIVLGFWVVIFLVAAPFAAQLTDEQNNEASSWLPASAESTKALEKTDAFQDPNAMQTVIVYERESGLTQADMAAAQAQAQQMQGLDGVEGDVVGPIPSEDGQAMQTIVTFNFGVNGWEEMPDAVDELRDIAEIDGVTVHMTGVGGQAADQAEAFAGLDTTLLYAAAGVVIVILL